MSDDESAHVKAKRKRASVKEAIGKIVGDTTFVEQASVKKNTGDAMHAPKRARRSDKRKNVSPRT